MRKIAVLFPGGGTQYVGMGRRLWERYQIVRDLFEEASDLLSINMKKLCFDTSLEALSSMENSQPATLTTSVAVYKAFTLEHNVIPSIGAGHSLGEYSALACTGAITFSDALKLIQRRGTLLQETGARNKGTMMAVNKVEAAIVEEAIAALALKDCYISVYNSPLQNVVSGGRASLKKLANRLVDTGAEATVLNINTTSHCPLMSEAAIELHRELKRLQIAEFTWPVVSNLTGRPYQNKESICQVLTDHMTHPVQWYKTIQYMDVTGANYWIDIGPQAVLKNLMRFAIPFQVPVLLALDVLEDAAEIERHFQPNFNGFIKNCLAIANATPNYNTNDGGDGFQTKVLNPYQRLRKIREDIDTSMASDETAHQAMEVLIELLNGKKVPVQEQMTLLQAAITENNLSDNLLRPVLSETLVSTK